MQSNISRNFCSQLHSAGEPDYLRGWIFLQYGHLSRLSIIRAAVVPCSVACRRALNGPAQREGRAEGQCRYPRGGKLKGLRRNERLKS